MLKSIDTYKVFADFYDAYVGKFNKDLDFYKTYCNKSDKIIEIGCGTGRILEYFLNLNYKIVGVDVSPEMLNKAEKRLVRWIKTGKLKLFDHDFTFKKFSDRFDKALLTFYTFNYIIDKPVDFLHHIYQSLNDNGLILMDLFYPKTLYDKTIDNFWIQKECAINGNLVKIKDNRSMADNTEYRQQIFKVNNKEIKIETIRKYYSPLDIKRFLETAGFKDIEFSYEYDLAGFAGIIDEERLKKNYIVKAKKYLE